MRSVTTRSEYLLFNPYHDELGRFARKPGIVVNAPSGGPSRERTAIEKKVFTPVADFLSREGFGYSALRFGLDIAMDKALYCLAGVHVTQGAALLASAAAGALIGGSLAPVLAGLGVGIAATMAWYMISERLTDKAFYGFINNYNSQIGSNIGLSTASKVGRGIAWMDRLSLSRPELFEFIGELIISGKGKSIIDATKSDSTSATIMTGSNMVSHAAAAPDIIDAISGAVGGGSAMFFSDPYLAVRPVDVRPATGREPGADRAKVLEMYPYVKNVNLGLTGAFFVPAIPETAGLDQLGFVLAPAKDTTNRVGFYVIDKAGSREFLKNMKNDTLPELGSFIWQDKDLENLVLPYAI